VKANALKGVRETCGAQDDRESTKKAASVVKAKVPAKAVPVPDHKVAKPDSVRLSGGEPTKVPAPAKAAKAPLRCPTDGKGGACGQDRGQDARKGACDQGRGLACPRPWRNRPWRPSKCPVRLQHREKTARPVSATKQAAAPKAGSVVTKAAEPTRPPARAQGAASRRAPQAGSAQEQRHQARRRRVCQGRRFVATQRASLLRERATYLEQAASLKAKRRRWSRRWNRATSNSTTSRARWDRHRRQGA